MFTYCDQSTAYFHFGSFVGASEGQRGRLRAGFKPIWPISSNRDPRQRGPRATPTNQHEFTLSIEAACVLCRRGAQCFLGCFERRKRFSFPAVSQNRVKTRFTTTIKIQENLGLQSPRYSDNTVAVSQNFFAVSKVKL